MILNSITIAEKNEANYLMLKHLEEFNNSYLIHTFNYLR